MKLLTKTSLNYLSVTLFVFLFATIAFYNILRHQVNQNINIELEKRKNTIVNQLLSAHSSLQTPANQNEKVIITPINQVKSLQLNFYDTLFFQFHEKKYVPFRQLGFIAEINNEEFYIQIYKSLEETDNLIVRVFFIMTVMVILIIIVLLITVRHTSLVAWNVFYDTIKKINQYDINSHNEFTLKQSEVKEFDDLNRNLKAMTERIKKDYSNMKEYTENASHEMQTPLAIINSKMEILLQSDNLNEKQMKAVADVYEASNRLSKLNKTLLLLAKIENRQFPDTKNINPKELINNQLENLEDLVLSKQLKVELHIEKDIEILMNPYLAEILLANLIKNAIRHNIIGGNLIINANKNKICISNSGVDKEIDTSKLYERFHKNSSSPDSLGLGLAIVQKICEVYHFSINYSYQNQMHSFCIDFKSSSF